MKDLPSVRKIAKKQDSPYYFTGLPCIRGHIDKRNTKSGKCFSCDIENSREFRKNNKDTVKASLKKYYEKNRDFCIGIQTKRYQEKKEQIDAYKKQYNLENKEKIKKQRLEFYKSNRERILSEAKKYRIKNLEKIKTQQKEHRLKNKEHYKQKNRNSKARRRKAVGSFTLNEYLKILEKQKYKCACCKKSIKKENHADHIVPIALGGVNYISNIQVLCPKCNLTKNAKDPIDFMQSKGFLL